MRASICLFFSFLIPLLSSLQAQVNYSADSLRVVRAEWRTDSLDGFVFKRYHFDEGALFCSAQHLFLIEIPPQSERRLAFVCDTQLTTVNEFARRASAHAAVNGSFFDMEKGNPVCYLRIAGRQWGENTPSATDSVNRKYYQYASLTLQDGHPSLRMPDSNRLWEETLADSNIMTAGPMLLRDGRPVPQRDDRTFVTHRHNRTALGLRPDGTTVILVVDGRFKDRAEGLSLPELERVMRWLGCRDAINLDGGGSSTMYIQGKPHDGVVNYPSDNKRHDHEGLRPVSNALLIL